MLLKGKSFLVGICHSREYHDQIVSEPSSFLTSLLLSPSVLVEPKALWAGENE
jgi:hypothetical protein